MEGIGGIFQEILEALDQAKVQNHKIKTKLVSFLV